MEIMSDEKLEVENVRLSAVNSPLKKGYKQTDVGLIPTEWNVKTFAEIFKFLATGTNSRSDLSEYGDIKYVHYGDIHTKWFVFLDCTTDPIPLIDKSKVAALPILCDGDLIMADASEDEAGIGISVEVKHTKNQKVVAGLHTFLLRGDKALVAGGFKAYIQYIKSVKNSLRKIATGVSVYGISKNNLRQVLVALPTLPEQQAISKILIDVDALISSLNALISKKYSIKQGAMQQLLTGKKRLSGFTENWEVKKIIDISPLQRGFDLPTTLLKKGIFPVVYSNGILNYHINYKAKAPGVVTGRSGTIGKVTFVNHDYWPHNTSLWVTDFKGNDPKFIYYIFTLIKLEKFSTGSGVPTLNRNDIHALKIPLSPLREQQAIAEVLSDIDAEIERLEQQRDKIKLIKQGMMQELLTGKTRLT